LDQVLPRLTNVRRRSTTTISAMGKAIALPLSRAAEQGRSDGDSGQLQLF